MQSVSLLRHLAAGVEQGHCFWALAAANEQLAKDDPIRDCLVARAKRRLGDAANNSLFCELARGKKLSQLSEDAAEQIRSLDRNTAYRKGGLKMPVKFCGLRDRSWIASKRRRPVQSRMRPNTVRVRRVRYTLISGKNSSNPNR
jgi:hypothetical protein